MKNLAMALAPGRRRHGDPHARADLLDTLDDHAIAGREPLLDQPLGADPWTDRDLRRATVSPVSSTKTW